MKLQPNKSSSCVLLVALVKQQVQKWHQLLQSRFVFPIPQVGKVHLIVFFNCVFFFFLKKQYSVISPIVRSHVQGKRILSKVNGTLSLIMSSIADGK